MHSVPVVAEKAGGLRFCAKSRVPVAIRQRSRNRPGGDPSRNSVPEVDREGGDPAPEIDRPAKERLKKRTRNKDDERNPDEAQAAIVSVGGRVDKPVQGPSPQRSASRP